MSDQLIRNEYGEAVLVKPEQPSGRADAFVGETAIQIANRFIAEKMAEMGLTQSRLDSDEAGLADSSRSNDPVMVVTEEKNIGNSTVVVYDQLASGLQIFNARMGVHVDMAERGVTSLQSSMHNRVEIANLGARAPKDAERKLTGAALKKKLGIDLPNLSKEGQIPRQVLYRYEPDERVDLAEDDHGGCFGDHEHVALKLPPVPDTIEKGKHYIVDEVLFKASRVEGETPVNWRALIEPKSGAILYIRALVASATGLVYARDPQTQTGAAVTGASSNTQLNPFRASEVLGGLSPGTPQSLAGEHVTIVDFDLPTAPPPTVPLPAGAFNYDVRTDNFSAVNGYFNCDRLFRTMTDYGFDVASYFDGTTFPVPVDHRARINSVDGNEVNASAPGNVMGNGLMEFRFALLQMNQPVGMTTSNRVVWHEFGHALLWDHVNSPNFGFAHSAGDSLAAILNDPGSNAPDRFDTFPWVQAGTPIGRRHDRAIADGWAWFGPQYNTQYRGEQILSTTLFRLYRSLGGDAGDIATQRRASQTVAYLIFKAIGLLSSTTAFPEVFVTNLQNADRTTADFKGIAGGALHKVVRWAFEKQGLFQPGASPGQGNSVGTEGNPPDVDVYIDDGRNGHYQYQPNHWSCQDMWVRRSADGGLTHQHPVVGVTNFMYVRVKNRGLQTANNVRVDAYHCLPGTGLAFPDDWTAMATPTIPASGSIAPGGATIIGPFAFVPTQVGHECLLAIAHADGDPGNDTTITGTIPEYRFVPFDNNIGQRNVTPVLPSLRHLVELFREHLILIRNPLKRSVVCHIDLQLPQFMRKLGWEMRVVSEGGQKFELGARDKRKVVLSIEPGKQMDPDLVKGAIANGDNEIKIFTFLDGELSGGMTYPVSFDAADGKPKQIEAPAMAGGAKEVGAAKATADSNSAQTATIEEILRVLRGEQAETGRADTGRRIRTVRFEIDFDE
ncbi:hypothetical protein [Mesorhizobium sp. M0698]|uniref:hypothetical protein n=1 Tax=Mesorhizobium sp. M0698 TaxID=2956987 RepID=UPI003337F309